MGFDQAFQANRFGALPRREDVGYMPVASRSGKMVTE